MVIKWKSSIWIGQQFGRSSIWMGPFFQEPGIEWGRFRNTGLHTCNTITPKFPCVICKDTGKPVHPPSMTRVLIYPSLDSLEATEVTCHQGRLKLHFCTVWSVFIVCMNKVCILGYPKCAQWRFWSHCTNVQAYLNFSWLHMSEGTVSDIVIHIMLWVLTR